MSVLATLAGCLRFRERRGGTYRCYVPCSICRIYNKPFGATSDVRPAIFLRYVLPLMLFRAELRSKEVEADRSAIGPAVPSRHQGSSARRRVARPAIVPERGTGRDVGHVREVDPKLNYPPW